MKRTTKLSLHRKKKRLTDWWLRQRILPVALGVFLGLFAFFLIVQL